MLELEEHWWECCSVGQKYWIFSLDGLRLTDPLTCLYRTRKTKKIPKTMHPLILMEDKIVIQPLIYIHDFSPLGDHKPIKGGD